MVTRQGYYQVVAEILPVLLLVLAVGEARLSPQREGHSTPGRVVALIAFSIGVIIAGEIAALRALVAGEDNAILQGLSVAGLAVGLSYLMIRTLEIALDELSEIKSESVREGRSRLVLLIAGMVYVATAVALASGTQ